MRNRLLILKIISGTCYFGSIFILIGSMIVSAGLFGQAYWPGFLSSFAVAVAGLCLHVIVDIGEGMVELSKDFLLIHNRIEEIKLGRPWNSD